MEKLGSYELTGHLTSQNSGYSIWGFGRKYGQEFFIKQFLSPKYPYNDTVSSAASIEKRKKKCQLFEAKKTALYAAINDHTDGNAVRVEEFFRVESKYYISMQKIDAIDLSIHVIASMEASKKRLLCALVAHAVAGLHKGRVVHADLKHDNVLFMMLPSGKITAKIIDFDSGFLETDPPSEGEEIIGDQVYFSPEACKTFMGEKPELTCKMDVFALGVLLHQYLTGQLPGFDTALGNFAGEAVANGGAVSVSYAVPVDLRGLLERMLDADPAKRPTAMQVYTAFANKPEEVSVPKDEPVQPEVPVKIEIEKSTTTGNPFFRPGDL